MNITAAQVKELRELTGIGMMECKKALVENDGNMEKAVHWLRERGMARAAKKSSRTAADGLVAFAIAPSKKEAAIIELNCETDFAAKNPDFAGFAETVANIALATKSGDIETIKKAKAGGSTVEETLAQLIVTVGENMQLRRAQFVNVAHGMVVGYKHMGGKIGTLIVLEGDETPKVAEVGADVAMHIAASAPRYLDRSAVDAGELEQEKALARKKLEGQGKPEAMVEKIVEGQMSKFYADTCLVDQPFVKEPKLSVAKYVAQSGAKTQPVAFVRFQLGEGIEVQETNFADEVAAQLKQ